jgi:protein TonB
MRFRSVVGTAVLTALLGGAHAETTPPTAPTPASSPSGDLSPTERAQRDADRVFQWIRIHADKPRKTTQARDEKAQTVAPAGKPSGKPLAKPADGTNADVAASRRDKPADAGAAPTASRAPATAEPLASKSAAQPEADASLLAAVAPPPAALPEPDAPLVPIVRTEPSFPASLMRTLRKGVVQVSFTVEPDGSVSKAQAVTSTNARLNSAALATVAQWRFQPLRHSQQAVVDLGFNLD